MEPKEPNQNEQNEGGGEADEGHDQKPEEEIRD